MKLTNSVLIIGGGTAGLITAIILKRKLNIRVDVIQSSKIGIIGVGEGSTEHWKEFMSFAGIDHYDLIKKCNATYKSGIMFENWTEDPYLHSVAGPYNSQTGQYKHVYGKIIADDLKKINPRSFWNNQIHRWFVNRPEAFTANQFHFDTHKLNSYLIEFSKGLGIEVYDDEIVDVNLNEDGYIESVKGTNQYFYDFFIDSTGFRRILMNKLGAKWTSFSPYLKMNSAVVFQTPDEENYNFWTLARAMDHGWMFRIPVWGRYGNGYIFNKEATNLDNVKKEIDLYFNTDVEIRKTFEFDPGCLDKFWIKNCVAIGLSGSFVEPLEASSIGTSIQQAFLLMHRISYYDQSVIDSYNRSMKDIMDNILDFIFLHYKTRKKNNEFWKHLSEIKGPDSLENNLQVWKNRLPIKEDFSKLSDYILFREDNFILVMEGLGLFNRDSIKKEYESLHPSIKYEAEKILTDQYRIDKELDTISHKKMLDLIRNNF